MSEGQPAKPLRHCYYVSLGIETVGIRTLEGVVLRRVLALLCGMPQRFCGLDLRGYNVMSAG